MDSNERIFQLERHVSLLEAFATRLGASPVDLLRFRLAARGAAPPPAAEVSRPAAAPGATPVPDPPAAPAAARRGATADDAALPPAPPAVTLDAPPAPALGAPAAAPGAPAAPARDAPAATPAAPAAPTPDAPAAPALESPAATPDARGLAPPTAPAPAPGASPPPAAPAPPAWLRRDEASRADDADLRDADDAELRAALADALLAGDGAGGGADDSDCEELEATTYTPAELSRRRYEAAVANGEVIEIASDDEAELGVDDATRAAEEAAAAQRDAEQQRVKRRKTADDADRDRRVAQFVVNARALNLGQLAAHCKSAGLKVGGTKQERIARLVYAIEYKVYERPRSDFFTRQIVAAFATKLDAIVFQNAA